MLTLDATGSRRVLVFLAGSVGVDDSGSIDVVIEPKTLSCKLAGEGAVDKLSSSDRTDPYDLQRFVDAQNRVYDTALTELRDGRKRSHWIWFVFPQIQGLGSSPTAIRYGITSLAEARAYLDHPVLGPRLRECARVVAGIQGSSADDIFGSPDNMKVRSSMTLFARAAESAEVQADFRAVLDRLYDGVEDELTVEQLAR